MPRGRSYTPMSDDQMEKSTTIYVDKEMEAIFLKEREEFGTSMRQTIAEAVKAYHMTFEDRIEQRKKDELKKIKELRKKTEAAIKKLEIEKALLLMEMSKLQELVV